MTLQSRSSFFAPLICGGAHNSAARLFGAEQSQNPVGKTFKPILRFFHACNRCGILRLASGLRFNLDVSSCGNFTHISNRRGLNLAKKRGAKSKGAKKTKRNSVNTKTTFLPKSLTIARMGAGRPPLEPQNYQELICEYVRKGNYVETSAAAAGVAKDTLYTWLKEGAKAPPDSPYRKFSDALHQAVAESETRIVERVEDHSNKGDLRADLWRLERRFPDRWGQRGRLEVTGEGGGPVRISQEFDFGRLTTEELETLERLLAKARPPKVEGEQ